MFFIHIPLVFWVSPLVDPFAGRGDQSASVLLLIQYVPIFHLPPFAEHKSCGWLVDNNAVISRWLLTQCTCACRLELYRWRVSSSILLARFSPSFFYFIECFFILPATYSLNQTLVGIDPVRHFARAFCQLCGFFFQIQMIGPDFLLFKGGNKTNIENYSFFFFKYLSRVPVCEIVLSRACRHKWRVTLTLWTRPGATLVSPKWVGKPTRPFRITHREAAASKKTDKQQHFNWVFFFFCFLREAQLQQLLFQQRVLFINTCDGRLTLFA